MARNFTRPMNIDPNPTEVKIDYMKRSTKWGDRIFESEPEDLPNRLIEVKKDIDTVLKKHYSWYR